MKNFMGLLVAAVICFALPSTANGQIQTDLDLAIDIAEQMGTSYVIMMDEHSSSTASDDEIVVIDFDPVTEIIIGVSHYDTDGTFVGGDSSVLGSAYKIPDYIHDRQLGAFTWNGGSSSGGGWEEP